MGRLPFTYKDLIPFVEPVMDHPRDVEKLARLVWAILASGSARKSDWARHYRKEAGERTNYKAIERQKVFPKNGVPYRKHPGSTDGRAITRTPPAPPDRPKDTLRPQGTPKERCFLREARRFFVWDALRYVEPETLAV